MNNTTLGCVAVDFEHILMSLVMLTASFRKNSGANYCTKMSYIRCWRCTEMWIHQTTRPFSYHQHCSEDISKQIRGASSSYMYVESGEFWRQHDEFISSGAFSGVARYI